jgi:hypothetical protein
MLVSFGPYKITAILSPPMFETLGIKSGIQARQSTLTVTLTIHKKIHTLTHLESVLHARLSIFIYHETSTSKIILLVVYEAKKFLTESSFWPLNFHALVLKDFLGILGERRNQNCLFFSIKLKIHNGVEKFNLLTKSHMFKISKSP